MTGPHLVPAHLSAAPFRVTPTPPPSTVARQRAARRRVAALFQLRLPPLSHAPASASTWHPPLRALAPPSPALTGGADIESHFAHFRGLPGLLEIGQNRYIKDWVRVFYNTFPTSAASHRTAPRTPPPRRPPTGTPPCRPLPAAPLSPALLGDTRLCSSCPVTPRDPTGAHRQHLAAGQPPPRRRSHAARGPPPRIGRAAKPWPSRPSGWPRVAGRRAMHCSRGPDSGPTLCGDFFKSFFNCFKFLNFFKFPKSVETCMSVQKLQNKFCWTPIEPLFTVGLTKLTFMQ
jgi:hypothetical protein